jgi:hypothetical protein
MSAAEPVASRRQWLSKRQSEMVNALLDAAVEDIRENGYESVSDDRRWQKVEPAPEAREVSPGE